MAANQQTDPPTATGATTPPNRTDFSLLPPTLGLKLLVLTSGAVLMGLAGTLAILIKDGRHHYEFDYTLPAQD